MQSLVVLKESLVGLSAHLAVIVVNAQSSLINRNAVADCNSICDASGMCHIQTSIQIGCSNTLWPQKIMRNE